MRRILVDHARSRSRLKRGGGNVVSFDEALAVAGGDSSVMILLDEALNRLSAFDVRKGRIVELIYFGGLTYEETSDAMDLSPATVHRELRLAKAWLHHELTSEQRA